MEKLLKEIQESLEVRKNGVPRKCYNWETKEQVEKRFEPERGIGTKAYTYRRIQMLQDKLKELKKDIENGKYDFKGR